MNQAEQIARALYYGLREHGLEGGFTCAWHELPHGHKNTLLDLADSIPLPDPWQRFNEFTARCDRIGHYTVAPLAASFKTTTEGSKDGHTA